MVLPLGEMATASTEVAAVLSDALLVSVDICHSSTTPVETLVAALMFAPPANRAEPFDENCTEFTLVAAVRKFASSFPVDTVHNCNRPDEPLTAPPTARVFPSGENAIDLTEATPAASPR
jgi:hypothetical protein